MKECPNCGKVSNDNSIFCEDCGTKLSEKVENNANSNNVVVNSNKIQNLKILGFSSLLISFLALIGALIHVKMINEDRLMLYSILSVMLSFYCAFKLNEYEETQKYALIIVAVSILFYIVAVML